ncbi:MAG TPA: hypothetical protein VIE43_21905 [Thermoanaerobaculia bacterium]|nr:hypothetical protein [Thermoanaerobaculia bacterium]
MHQRPDRLSLVGQVAKALRATGIPFAKIGAAAMAIHGVMRSTADEDLLVVDGRCLQSEIWSPLRADGADVDIRKGDVFDPLAGVVRIFQEGQRPVDVVVGKFAWQRDMLERATSGVSDETLPVVRVADIILLKLYAGGPQDAWDILQLLALEGRDRLIAQVDQELPRLPAASAVFWKKILDG